MQKGQWVVNITTVQPYDQLKLDAVIAIPREFVQATVLGADLSSQFVFYCSVVGNDMSSDPRCLPWLFSITTDYLDGVLVCGCHPVGSNSSICEEYGGQCSCKPGVGGRDCSRCKPGFYNLTQSGCTPCGCQGSINICEEYGGQCWCAPGVGGRDCSRCKPGFYNRTQSGCTHICRNNWIHFQGSCYKLFSNNVNWMNWTAAKSACEALGSKLVSINSRAEQQAIGANVTSNNWFSAWIGLYRDPQDYWSWLWVDGSRPNYTNWYPGEPNNLGGEGCGEIYPQSYEWKWNDLSCYLHNRPYICETDFIGECAVSNGGNCSHKCVNTAEGYKCECPDPGLVLSMDNKTCQAPGVDVQCNNENMTIIIPKSFLRGIDREHLRLLDTTCKAEETSAHFSLATPLTGCNTTRRYTPTAIVYSNTVLEIPVAAEDVVTRVREIEIQFSCFYSKYGVVSSVGWKPSNRKLVFSDEGKGNFTLSLNMFPDKRFVSPYTKDDFPVAVVLRKLLFFEVSVTSGDKQLSIIADRCYATPTQDQKSSLKYEFIRKGCPNDVTVKYHSASSVSTQRFSLEAFKFIADHPFVFVHCHVIVCNATDPDSQCAKKCPSSGRGRRAVSDHVTDVYSLAQGPLHLAREKRDETRGSSLDKSGSSPTFLMMVVFVMCIAFLAGTALLIFKKSRDKPAGYAVLVSGDKE
ncbi:uncharacterized protein LOC144660589 isoform X2 [Oculina patagonica]